MILLITPMVFWRTFYRAFEEFDAPHRHTMALDSLFREENLKTGPQDFAGDREPHKSKEIGIIHAFRCFHMFISYFMKNIKNVVS